MEMDPNTMLAVAFGLWSGVVGLGTRALLKRIDRVAQWQEEHGQKFNGYLVKTEARLAVVERELRINGRRKDED